MSTVSKASLSIGDQVTLTIQQICIRFLSIYEPSLVGCLISLQEHYINDDGDSGEVGGRHLHLFYQ